MTSIGKKFYFILTVVFFVVFDLILSDFLISRVDIIPATPVLDLIYVRNTGAAFSILQNSKIFLISFSAIACIAIIFYIIKHIAKTSLLSLFWVSLLVAGIFCNLAERVLLGYVRDFFKLNFINFPVFNISDIFINLSVFAIVVIIIKHNFSKNNEINGR